MHYLQGRHRWVVAVAIAIVLAAAAIVSNASNQDMVPLAPGPISTPTPFGSM